MTVGVCDPSELWIKHNIRWLDKGKHGAGWYKLKMTGRATFFVRLTQKACPICDFPLNPSLAVSYFHPRPAAWLEAQDKKHRDDEFRAKDAERVLAAMTGEEST